MSEDTCQSCSEHFWSPLSREAHMKLYPWHFSGVKLAAATKEDAVSSDVKVKRRTRRNVEEENP